MYIGDYYKVVVQLAHRSSLHSSLAWLVCIQQSENCVHIFPLTQWSPRSSRGCRRNRWKLWPPSTALEQAACQHQEVLVLAIRCSYRTNENPVSSYMHESTCSFVVSCMFTMRSKCSRGLASSQSVHQHCHKWRFAYIERWWSAQGRSSLKEGRRRAVV